ncbi:MAG: trypsin-like peptidase domain-containing protein [Planctomycetaceae bacterium]|nr:trypsin-like peptidase domain-containing protein [Planctomycetaceae bacterium]
MSAEMTAAMQGSGSGGSSVPGTPGSLETSLNGQGASSGGARTKRATVPADAAFLDELNSIEIAEEEFSLPDLIEMVEPSVVRINTRSKDGYSVGSGYVVSSSGLVVTNYHVIEGIKEATVEFSDGTKGKVTGYRYFDPKYDIAVIQIEVEDRVLVPLPLAEELPRKGASVVAFGAPHGLSFTTTEGIISAIRTQEEMQSQMGLQMNGTWLQTSTPISSGNSGGPLVNMHGQVVGMNTMQMTVGQNLNFAVSSIDVLDLAKQASGSKMEKLDPAKLIPIDRSVKRRLAPNLAGTERGNELLAGIDEIWLLLVYQNSSIDPSGQLKRTVYAHAQSAIEKTGIQLSFGEPSGDAALMIVTLKTNLLRKAAPGTQMVTLDAFLVGIDPEVKSSNKMVKLWSIDDVSIGTVALQAISQGYIPRTFPPKFTSFFNKFRTAQSKAKRAVKTKEG